MRRLCVLLAALAAVGGPGCVSSARSAVATVAQGVHVADAACATLVRSPTVSDDTAREIGARCVTGYKLARTSLLAAESAIDVAGEVDAGRLACAGAKALEGLAMIVSALVDLGVKMPGDVDRAVAGATFLARMAEAGGTCGK